MPACTWPRPTPACISGARRHRKLGARNQAVAEFKEAWIRTPIIFPQSTASAPSVSNGGQPFDPRIQESKTYHQKHIQLKPDDPEPYYWIGVID